MAYETVNPTLIPNTIMSKYINSSGVFIAYNISPVDGYVLHDNAGNWMDLENNECEAYYTGTCSCGPNYDFTDTVDFDGYTAYGPREFFARPASEVPADQIFGGVNNDHEVM